MAKRVVAIGMQMAFGGLVVAFAASRDPGTLMPVPWVLAGNGLLLVLLGATILLRRNPEGVAGL